MWIFGHIFAEKEAEPEAPPAAELAGRIDGLRENLALINGRLGAIEGKVQT
jgi:hypothetical protein